MDGWLGGACASPRNSYPPNTVILRHSYPLHHPPPPSCTSPDGARLTAHDVPDIARARRQPAWRGRGEGVEDARARGGTGFTSANGSLDASSATRDRISPSCTHGVATTLSRIHAPRIPRGAARPPRGRRVSEASRPTLAPPSPPGPFRVRDARDRLVTVVGEGHGALDGLGAPSSRSIGDPDGRRGGPGGRSPVAKDRSQDPQEPPGRRYHAAALELERVRVEMGDGGAVGDDVGARRPLRISPWARASSRSSSRTLRTFVRRQRREHTWLLIMAAVFHPARVFSRECHRPRTVSSLSSSSEKLAMSVVSSKSVKSTFLQWGGRVNGPDAVHGTCARGQSPCRAAHHCSTKPIGMGTHNAYENSCS